MNAVNTLLRERIEAALEAAVAAASKWTEIGRPIILATIRLDGEADDALLPLAEKDAGTWREARSYLRDARKALEEMLEGIRDDFLADQLPPQPRPGAPDEEWDERDAFAEALAEEVISVRRFVKQVEDEDYQAWLKGGR